MEYRWRNKQHNEGLLAAMMPDLDHSPGRHTFALVHPGTFESQSQKKTKHLIMIRIKQTEQLLGKTDNTLYLHNKRRTFHRLDIVPYHSIHVEIELTFNRQNTQIQLTLSIIRFI